MASEPAIPARLRRSHHLSWFTHMGAVYLFHDLYGYLMEMSPDIADIQAERETGGVEIVLRKGPIPKDNLRAFNAKAVVDSIGPSVVLPK